MSRSTLHTIAVAALFAAVPAITSAQTTVATTRRASVSADSTSAVSAKAATTTTKDTLVALKKAPAQLKRLNEVQDIRPVDQSGILVFESPKEDLIPFDGLRLGWGAAFTQDFQSLNHQNTAVPVVVAGINQNALMPIGSGFTTAMANLNMSVQLAKGIHVDLTTYLSTRHHTDTWVKGGYLQMDASPIDLPLFNAIMEDLTIRAGQFEVNYGDAHYRRTDAGNGMYNPFVGNLIMDAYTTEIGSDFTYRKNGFLAMAGFTGGASDGQVTSPGQHQPALLAKLGYDKQVDSDLRIRLTASTYNDRKSTSNVLYSGDRGGSHYFDVLQNTTSTESGNAWSGNIQPGFTDHVASYVVNPFVKYDGLELFGNFETATGSALSESSNRTWTQSSGDIVYRFLANDAMYVAARYNTANGTLIGSPVEVNVNRTQLGLGWFMTRNILTKLEWINQNYNNFATNNIFNGGNFRGFMLEGAVGF